MINNSDSWGDLDTVRSLADLNRVFDTCPRCSSVHNSLQHVYGGGRTRSPEYCFVLINPTYRNLSTDPLYRGTRFPFIGVRAFWRVLHRGGFLSDRVMKLVNDRPWNDLTTRTVLDELRRQSVYLTNLVKCAQNHPDVPNRQVFAEDLPLFSKELSLVRPKRIVAFGRLTVNILTGQWLKLHDYHKDLTELGRHPDLYFYTPKGNAVPVFPSFFPVSRGNPALCADVLRQLKSAPT